MTERELVVEYKRCYDALKEAEQAKKNAQSDFEKIQSLLIDELESKGASSTAKYDVGRVSLDKPRLFANVLKENQGLLFSYLESIGRSDLIKPSVHPSTLSSFVGELTLEGREVPEFINVSSKRTARVTA